MAASSAGVVVVVADAQGRPCMCVAPECGHDETGCSTHLGVKAHANAKYCKDCVAPMHRLKTTEKAKAKGAIVAAAPMAASMNRQQGREEAGLLNVVVKKAVVKCGVDSAKWSQFAQWVLDADMGDDVKQRQVGMVKVVGGVRELYAPHLPGCVAHAHDNVVGETVDGTVEDGIYSSFQLVNGFKRRRYNDDEKFNWDTTERALAESYTQLMDSWMGPDGFFLHATSVLVSNSIGSSLPRALVFTTATPANHSQAYRRGDQTFPCDMELVYADLATGAQNRKAWLDEACSKLRQWAVDLKLFGLISFESVTHANGQKISNSPLARWMNSRGTSDIGTEFGGDGRSAKQLAKWRNTIVNTIESLEYELGLRMALPNNVHKCKSKVAGDALRTLGGRHPPYGQLPHIDLGQGEIQLTTSLTSATAPTLVYQGQGHVSISEMATRVGRSAAQVMGDGFSDYRQLCLPRDVLVEGLHPPCGVDTLDSGDVIIMRGGIVHARPY